MCFPVLSRYGKTRASPTFLKNCMQAYVGCRRLDQVDGSEAYTGQRLSGSLIGSFSQRITGLSPETDRDLNPLRIVLMYSMFWGAGEQQFKIFRTGIPINTLELVIMPYHTVRDFSRTRRDFITTICP